MTMYALLLLWFVGAYSAEIDLFIDPAKYIYKLEPTDIKETTWSLTTVPGSRIVMNCHLLVKDCNLVKFEAGKKGQAKYKFCDVDIPQLNSALSNDNSIQLTIRNKGDKMPAYCNVSAPPSFLNLNEAPPPDSGEEGKQKGESPTCRCGWRNNPKSRIFGGQETLQNEYPFIAALTYKDERPFCGGSILTPYHILTAAHCYNSSVPSNVYRVIVGAHNIKQEKYNKNTQVLKVKKIIPHEKYDDESFKNDLAIVYLDEKININQFVGPVCMPNSKRNLVGEHLKVMGWGFLNEHYYQMPDTLHHVKVKVVNNNVCKNMFQSKHHDGAHICTYSKKRDNCQGDSGGPLVLVNKKTNLYTLEGAVSFGAVCGGETPSTSTYVYAFMDWIKAKIKETKDHKMCY